MGDDAGADGLAPLDDLVADPRIRSFGLLLEAYSQLTRRLDADLHHSDDISLQTFEVLIRIYRSPEGHLTMSELAGEVSLTTGGVTRLADRLEKDGLVQRVACPTDRRVVHLALTDHGAEVLRCAVSNHLDSLQRHMFDRIEPKELHVLDRVTDQLRSQD